MVVTDSEIMLQDEVESPLQSDQQSKNQPFSSLGRQSSIYSLTLDEFQHSLCENGKNFGSMNMDEFLNSIWTAEENQATGTANGGNQTNGIIENRILNDVSGDRGISRQPSLSRQGSLTLPPPLCRKTVEEVWSEIHGGQQQGEVHVGVGGGDDDDGENVQNSETTTPRRKTFGEMTLEDFLIKAGVVREHGHISVAPPQQQHYGIYQNSNNNPSVGAGFVSMLGMGMTSVGGAAAAAGAGYQTMPSGSLAESSGRTSGYGPTFTAPPPMTAVYGGPGTVGNGGGYGTGQAVGVVGPVSPVSPEGIVGTVDNAANQFGMEMGGLRGRKRVIDGPVEKVVERRQRRMIKNRESAARSRARKQAYTVELEAELNQLKEENKQLKTALAELERKRKQQFLEELRLKAQTRTQKAKDKMMGIRRNLSCPF